MRIVRLFPRPWLAGQKSYYHRRHVRLPCLSTSLIPIAACPTAPPPLLLSRSYAKRVPEKKDAVLTLKGDILDRAALDSMLKRRMFYTPSFEVYGGVSGFYDYGPPGCALQQGIIDVWRKHFVLEEDMLEIDCAVMTPKEVFQASGHVDRFTDAMCRDPESQEMFRADHFIVDRLKSRIKDHRIARGEEPQEKGKRTAPITAVFLTDAQIKEYEQVMAKIDSYTTEELGGLIKQYNLTNPATRIQPLPPIDFQLMFQTTIDTATKGRGYLRPETSQGQFLNFTRLFHYNRGQMPFASACVGKAFRNEISPRAGLLRVREFLLAEIEHYVDPRGDKKHPRFDDVRDVELPLLNKETQLAGRTDVQRVTIGEAVANGTVDNETLGYFLARIALFLKKIGIDEKKMRFRQHMKTEMAHYASDCWDAEILTSYGWIECVGCADRSAYDLGVHAKKTGASLVARESLTKPDEVTQWEVHLIRKLFGPLFGKKAKFIEAAIFETTQSQRERFAEALKTDGFFVLDLPGYGNDGKVNVPYEVIEIEKKTREVNYHEYIPHVVEPSFGIGRILYALLEHCYWSRGVDPKDSIIRSVLSFPVAVAPTKVVIASLSNDKTLQPFCHELSKKLRTMGISNRVDSSGSHIGKRYSRNDEIGTPLGITVDFQTIQDKTFTLRDRDTMDQVRAGEDEILAAVSSIVQGTKTWGNVAAELPAFSKQDIEDTGSKDAESEDFESTNGESKDIPV